YFHFSCLPNACPPTEEKLILNEEFDSFNLDLWKHEITMGGGGNWEFQMYGNNRTNSYVEDGKLFLQPTLTSDYLGEDQLRHESPIVQSHPSAPLEGHFRVSCDDVTTNMAARIPINPVMSARVRSASSQMLR
ncbi:unnamed protein product, partial [Scytosiphon promiscuus]